MQSRRDQVQAHLFVMGRLGAGMLRAEPDAPDTPTGRTNRGIRTGLYVGIAIAVVMGLYGVIAPGGSTAWRKPGTLVVVKKTGARYLFLGGELHPVLNQSSARLLAGEKMPFAEVSEKSLKGAPRGAPVGIVGAPDGLPAARELSAEGWLACGLPRPASASGAGAPQIALAVAMASQGTPLTDGQGVLAATPDGERYLLWQGRRLRLDSRNGAVSALGYGSATPYPVAAAFLNTLPAGPDLAPADVPGRGGPGPVLAGHPTTTGQLFTGPGGEAYVLAREGLRPLTRTEFELLRGDPRTQREAYAGAPAAPAAVGAADLAAHPATAATAGPGSGPGSGAGAALPAEPPRLLAPAPHQSVCTGLRPGAGGPATLVTLADTAAVAGAPPAVQPGVEPTCADADRIMVRPGGGALVQALSGAGTGSTSYLVTDAGVKYPLPSADAAKRLGYAAVRTVGVPAGLLKLLPTGPSLDPEALAAGGVVSAAPSPPCSARTSG
ncbi:type VII secretion protein EccB [Streptomyces sp. 4.24]|uniref:type VII secretion protein EccB n=1 Tax=Streptomyces tritrimontium TaxID=3406573 RepID=UPI003BB777E8